MNRVLWVAFLVSFFFIHPIAIIAQEQGDEHGDEHAMQPASEGDVSPLMQEAEHMAPPEPAPVKQENHEPTHQEPAPATQMSAPVATAPEEHHQQEIHLSPDEIVGIDTVDLAEPQGNWLYKRVWWERAEAKYEKIRAEVGKIMESRTIFFANRADLDKNVLDPFYIKIGLSQGELLEMLKNLIEKLEKSISTEKNDDLLEKAQEDKRSLEKLQTEVQGVMRQDEELENAVMMLVNQISKLRTIEQQAWQDFKSIARVLDDRKARELFYRVENGWRNTQELSQYIQGLFSTSFNQLIERIKGSIATIEGAVNALKEKGIELKSRAQEPVIEEPEQEEPQGFFSRYIMSPIKTVFGAIWSVIRWPYDAVMRLFGFGQEPEEQEEIEPEEVVQETSKEETPVSAPVVSQPAAITPQSPAPAPAVVSAPETNEEPEDEEEYEVEEDEEEPDYSEQEEDSAPAEHMQESLDHEE